DELLRAPVDQVFGGGIAKPFVAVPAAGPHEMPDAIRSLRHGRVAHEFFLADLRFQEGAAQVGPVTAVTAIEEIEPGGGRFAKRGKEIDFFPRLAGSEKHYREQYAKDVLHL